MKIDECYANAKNQAERRTKKYEAARDPANVRERRAPASPRRRLRNTSGNVDLWYWAIVVSGFAGFAALLLMGY